MNGELSFTGTPSQLRKMYEHGWGIADIMERTGKPYIEIRSKLLEAQTNLITGGPHNVNECDHVHDIHTYGTNCCRANSRLRRKSERF